MANVYKTITKGASYVKTTEAVGELQFVLRTGIMPCGNGDDHVLSVTEMDLVKKHNSATDLNLPEGPLGRKRK